MSSNMPRPEALCALLPSCGQHGKMFHLTSCKSVFRNTTAAVDIMEIIMEISRMVTFSLCPSTVYLLVLKLFKPGITYDNLNPHFFFYTKSCFLPVVVGQFDVVSGCQDFAVLQPDKVRFGDALGHTAEHSTAPCCFGHRLRPLQELWGSWRGDRARQSKGAQRVNKKNHIVCPSGITLTKKIPLPPDICTLWRPPNTY